MRAENSGEGSRRRYRFDSVDLNRWKKGSHPSREGKPKSMSKEDELPRSTYERDFIYFTLSKSISRSSTILICAAAAFTFERESACSDRSTVWGA